MLGKKVLLAHGDVTIALCRYAPSERHELHVDRHSRVSFLLAGGYREDGHSGSIRMRAGEVLLKSRRARHEDQFGDEGACIASIEFIADDPFDDALDPRLWRRSADFFALRHASDFLAAAQAGDANGASVAGNDLVSAGAHETLPRRNAPAWLARLKEQLEERSLAAVDVGAWAKAAGAHPAHASRLFRQCYGLSITEHATAHAVRRAIGCLASPDLSLCDVALAAGFYDQSHMSRVFRRELGRTPANQRDLLSALRG